MTDILNQKSLFEQVNWTKKITPRTAASVLGKEYNITEEPSPNYSGMTDKNPKPYWAFKYKINDISGILLTDVNVKNTLNFGSVETVFSKIDFTDFEVRFDHKDVKFNLPRAFNHPLSKFEYCENGVIGKDKLFQKGMRLILTDNVLHGETNQNKPEYCFVTIEISVVFRGEGNDFDPGGIPVALKIYPQITYSWGGVSGGLATNTRSVKKIRGSVRLTTNNKMPPMFHAAHNHFHPVINANVASFFCDSNVPINTDTERSGHYGLIIKTAAMRQVPAGWGTLFDYAHLNIELEKEILGCKSSSDIGYTAKNRKKNYLLHSNHKYLVFIKNPDVLDITREIIPIPSLPMKLGIPFNINKTSRQGSYDNIHVHGKMASSTSPQIHAPFCGHSCIHFHWRWAEISVNGASNNRGSNFKGWSNPAYGIATANSWTGYPLIPPNQRLTLALCKPSTERTLLNVLFSQNILDSNQNGQLDPLNKKLWYCVDINLPQIKVKHVIFEHGIGWAYRYSKPKELSKLINAITLPDKLADNPTNDDMATFFAETIYPMMTYVEGEKNSDGTKELLYQIPEGNLNPSMETL